MYQRKHVSEIVRRMHEGENPLMQCIVGARQTGKSTMIAQAIRESGVPAHAISADDVLAPNADWIRTEWQQARLAQERGTGAFVLAIDEIQKVPEWPNVVKGLWDADQREGRPLKVILSGSSSLLLRKGLEDSLTGRFELIHSPHWSLAECRDAFGFTLEDFLFFGGFPGAARLVRDEGRWADYVRNAIIEPTITHDVLAGEDVRKPALMRALFELGALFSAQELSYTKMLGQLQEAGNTTTLANYLTLLDKAGMLTGLEKCHPKALNRRKSSPRLMVFDTALMTALRGVPRELVLGDSELRGHLVESAIGAYLLARAPERGFSVHWWREGSNEVDFVVESPRGRAAIEVKSGRTKGQGGMAEFLRQFPDTQRIVIGGSAAGSVSIEDFLLTGVDLLP